MSEPVVIVSYSRTPMGAFKGCFSTLSAVELGASAIKGCLNKISTTLEYDEVLMGCVLSAGLGQSPARQSAILAGLPESVCSTTINKVCGSGMRSIMIASDSIAAGSCNIAIAGGMESMTNTPYLLPQARLGYMFGHGKIVDHMMRDGLEDAYLPNGVTMGMLAEETAEIYNFNRAQQDEFALRSVTLAQQSAQEGRFLDEITPVTVRNRKGDIIVDKDENVTRAIPEKIKTLKPAFKKDGTITAASASSIADGAAAFVLMKESVAEKSGLTPIAKICGYSSFSHAPRMFTTAPVGAVKKLMKKLNWQIKDVDLFEINEAFAVVTMATIKDLGLDIDKVNVRGGSCAMGHPLGASGARILATLLNALKYGFLKKGVATLCVGGGEAVAMGVELY